MFLQTISLFRYLISGIISRRLIVLTGLIYVAGILISSFVSELAMTDAQVISTAFLADFIRYSLVILNILLITTNVADDFEYRQFERLLTMPLSRWQFVVAEVMVIFCISIILVLPVVFIVAFTFDASTGLYWGIAVWLELVLTGVAALFAILSLEKVSFAVFFTLAVYLLSKLSGLIGLMLSESVRLTDGSLSSRFAESIFNAILYILPGQQSFAQNDVYFIESSIGDLLSLQFQSVVIYTLFIIFACLVDFYRKEFNR